jgi:hypothetical protein
MADEITFRTAETETEGVQVFVELLARRPDVHPSRPRRR